MGTVNRKYIVFHMFNYLEHNDLAYDECMVVKYVSGSSADAPRL
jgi:hypothetical protein